MRKVGRMGESRFAALCDSVGITQNSSINDEKGWDFFIQFPFEFTGYYDQTPSPIRALVQVKSTDDRKRNSERITLLNLLHLVKSEIPAFFCFIKYNGEELPQSIYIMHVGDDLIKETLKTIREKQILGKIKLNKTKLTIKFKKEHKLESICGQALKECIEKHIPDGIQQYIKKVYNY